jgi:hypothetical protein
LYNCSRKRLNSDSVKGIGIMEVAIMTVLMQSPVIILSYIAFSPFDPQICPKSNQKAARSKKTELELVALLRKADIQV